MTLAKLSNRATTVEPPFALPAGTSLSDDYRVDAILGVGATSITYLATELSLGRTVAIKEFFPKAFAIRHPSNQVLPKSPSLAGDYQRVLDRFIQQARAHANFDHNAIVRVHRTIRANDTGYAVLQFEEGLNFYDWLARLGRPPSQPELFALIMPVLDALDLIHRHKAPHGGIAPDKIIIRQDGGPVLIDFCSAGAAEMNGEKKDITFIKHGFSPVEQYVAMSEAHGPWTDIYAVGATLYLAVTGNQPTDAPRRVTGNQLVPAAQIAVDGYCPRFLRAIDHAMELPPSDRPRTVNEWRCEILTADFRASSPRIAVERAPIRPATPAAHSEPAKDLEMPVFLRKPPACEVEEPSRPAERRHSRRITDVEERHEPLLSVLPPAPAAETAHDANNELSFEPRMAPDPPTDEIEVALQKGRTAIAPPDRSANVNSAADFAALQPERLMKRLGAALDLETSDMAEPPDLEVDDVSGPSEEAPAKTKVSVGNILSKRAGQLRKV
ncbi:MAG: serine/threonine protein kinase, partial [Methyloligellaceae bacterium]